MFCNTTNLALYPLIVTKVMGMTFASHTFETLVLEIKNEKKVAKITIRTYLLIPCTIQLTKSFSFRRGFQ